MWALGNANLNAASCLHLPCRRKERERERKRGRKIGLWKKDEF